MFTLLLIFLGFLLVAAIVLAFAAYTHRGVPMPLLPRVDARMHAISHRVHHRIGGPLENTAIKGALIADSVVLGSTKDHHLRQRFMDAEHKIVSKLPRTPRRRRADLRPYAGLAGLAGQQHDTEKV